MSTHTERAARMGYTTTARRAVAPTPRAQAAARMYDHGGLSLPISSYFDRRESGLQDDREGYETARKERHQVEAFARARGISAQDLHTALAVMGEHERFPKSTETIATRRAATMEALRLEHGGAEAAQSHLRCYVNVTSELAKAVPTLAARANETGAGEDRRFIDAFAHYGVTPKPE